MNQRQYLSFLRLLLRFSSIYLLGEAIVYLSGIRLVNLHAHWPTGAVFFLQEYQLLWGAVSLFLAYLLLKASQQPQELWWLITSLAYLASGLALILLFMSRIPFNQLLPTPQANLWLPDYSFIITLESGALLFFSLFILYGNRHKYFRL